VPCIFPLNPKILPTAKQIKQTNSKEIKQKNKNIYIYKIDVKRKIKINCQNDPNYEKKRDMVGYKKKAGCCYEIYKKKL